MNPAEEQVFLSYSKCKFTFTNRPLWKGCSPPVLQGLDYMARKFLIVCRKAESAIDDVVSPEARGPPPEGLELEGGPEVMRWMPYHNEGFRGKIRDSLMEHEIAEVSMLHLRCDHIMAQCCRSQIWSGTRSWSFTGF